MAAPESLALRARRVRSRAAVRSWEYRQRHHAKGVWFRLRRVLAGARRCWSIADLEARTLVAEGFRPEPVGHELEPPRDIFVLPVARIDAIPDKVPLRVGLTAELLSASTLVLEPFEEARTAV